ncbi:MAG: hypothetical protein H0Z29_07945 [Candidatus Marinimicrobia bacterium]|nr:hypothetical protein [Candidatus Neomarinimicrobiota bacterium]
MTNRYTGEIFYNENAFKDGYHKFLEVSAKEKWLSNMVKNGVLPENWLDAEVLSYRYVYRNQGLVSPYSNPQFLYYKSINYIRSERTDLIWGTKWWHFVYRISRRY